MLKFFCATAGKSFDSGNHMDAETYARERLNIVTAECPHCHRNHSFLVADAEFRPFTAQGRRSATG